MSHQTPPKKLERQEARTLDEIRKDHVERYRWALPFVSGMVLDAACGCGYGTHLIATQAPKVRSVLGVDNSADAINYACKHWMSKFNAFMLADLSYLTLTSGFDWVVSFETIEHIEHPGEILQIFREAAPHLIGSVPNETGRPFSKEQFPFHYRHYTLKQLKELLWDTGWDVRGVCGQVGVLEPPEPLPTMKREPVTLTFIADRR